MLIGSQYADNMIYRGIRHYDSLPLMMEDLHEYRDTVYMKTAYIMNNIIGYGILNTPKLSMTATGIRLDEPAVVIINGDVSLIQSDDNNSIVNIEEISSAGYSSGTVCIVGWYQHIDAKSTLRNYGGVLNSTLPNNLLDNKFNVQLSTRYQFRWMPIILNTDILRDDSISFNLRALDKEGNPLESTYSITTQEKKGNVFIAPAPADMDYALTNLYIIPLIKYSYDSASNSVSDATMHLPVASRGSAGFISSESEPVGEYTEGTTWYNPITREFKTYVEGDGFVSQSSTMGFLQYQTVYSMPVSFETAQDIIIPVNISELQEGDILQVVYEGLTLTAGEHYEIDYTQHTAKLLNFTADVGDTITFTATKIVEANDITNITTTFTSHMAMTGSATREAHVKLSDSIDSNSDVNDGVAATPKAVYDSKLILDPTTNTRYKFGVENGLLYIEEV